MHGGKRENTGQKKDSQHLHVLKPVPLPTVEYRTKEDLIDDLKRNMERIVYYDQILSFAESEKIKSKLWDQRRSLKHQLAQYETQDPTQQSFQ